MTFDTLRRLTQERLNLKSQDQAGDFLYWLFDTIEESAVEKGAPVRIPNFGTFKTRTRKARIVKTPTGEIMDLPPIKFLGFKLSQSRVQKQ